MAALVGIFLWVFLEDAKLCRKAHNNRFSYDMSLLFSANWIGNITNKSISRGIFTILCENPSSKKNYVHEIYSHKRLHLKSDQSLGMFDSFWDLGKSQCLSILLLNLKYNWL